MIQQLSPEKSLGAEPYAQTHTVPGWLVVVASVCVVLGVFFRFDNLESKIRWMDEASDTMTIAGFDTGTRYVYRHLRGRVLTTAEVKSWLQIQPDTSVATTIGILAAQKPHYAPLYFILARLWAEVSGTSLSAMRGLTAAISTLSLPLAYWLGMELFEEPVAALVFLALVAVAPMNVIFAQEINRYSLWMLTMFASSASLLRACKRSTPRRWLAYACASAVSLYTNLPSALIMASHAVYVHLLDAMRGSSLKRRFYIAGLLAAGLSIPWIVQVLTHVKVVQQSNEALLTGHSPLIRLLGYLACEFTLVFFDPSKASHSLSQLATIFGVVVDLTALAWIGLKYRQKFALLAGALIACNLLPLVLSDLVMGGYKSCFQRYMFPWMIGFEIATAALLATQMCSKSPAKRSFAGAVLTVLLVGGLASDLSYCQSDNWWSKNPDEYEVAHRLNRGRNPLWVGMAVCKFDEAAALCEQLDPKVGMFLPKRRQDTSSIICNYDPVWFFFFSNHPQSNDMHKILSENGETSKPIFGYWSK